MENITLEWLESIGFKLEPNFGAVKDIAEGPEETSLAICVGNHPWNSPAVTILIAGFGIVLPLLSRDDLTTLLRLLEGAQIDHPYAMEIDDDEFDVS